MNKKTESNFLKRRLILAIASLSLWLVMAVGLILMLNSEGGIEGIILNQPMLFFGLLAASVFFLATGLNNMISYFKSRNN